MFIAKRRARVSLAATLVAVGAALLAILAAANAGAHHPGSHAVRQPDGRVLIDVVATATDGCTMIASVSAGPPPGVAPPSVAAPVVARLRRQGTGPCTAVVMAVRAQAELELGPDVRQILLYILSADGRVAASERVPVR